MINRIFSDMVSNIGSNIQDTSSAMQTIIKRYVNDTYFDFLRRINHQAVNYNYTVAIISGQQDYPLIYDFGKEMYVYDATNQKQLSYISTTDLVENFPESLSVVGTADKYTIINSPIRKSLPGAEKLLIASDSASDTTQLVRIKGIDSNDIEISESVTLVGTTPQQTTATFKDIRAISFDSVRAGTVTITSSSTSTVVAIVASGVLDYKIKLLRLFQIPGYSATYKIPYIINPLPLSTNYDTPIVDCSDILELGATMRAFKYKRQFSKAQEYERSYESSIVQFIWDKENQPNQIKQFNPKTYDRDYV